MSGAHGELSSFDSEFAHSFRSDRFHLILLPTEQCNFRCTYCYEDFAIGRMEPEVVSGVKNLIGKRADAGLRHLQVSWFGGEPMLGRSIIEDVADYACRVQEGHEGLFYEADMTTNGYMLDGAAVEHLASLGVRAYQVSLDGLPEHHDRTRLRADGKGTFQRIWRNLLSIRECSADVRMLLRVHLTPENLSGMPEFLTRIRDTFLDDPRFSVFLKRVVHLGGPNDSAMEVVDEDDRKIADLEALLVKGGGTERLFEPEEVCYAARANSLLVRADGRLGKCTVALSDDANTIGRILPDGSLDVDNPKLRRWLQGWESRDPELNACPYLAFTEPQPLLQIGKGPLAAVSRD
ncbi:radical SAM protein [Streptomyces sp. MB09-01]|uniref:radical SAM protein n=1 Tax=Streptomyces sp. MB09-01 TaxID=3028666 RepID=UPI0029B62EE5|nr:radical SAM protein [Streptomyces sp. MB09-01]MDX3533565.1 radical SAM protein [Streptomyces sp. MB09-01]